ncbi:helix-turn-helix domain-containing protein [Enterococcus faecalis]|uniref:helix-turn-helix domain-containing protein n=1 Tax=Enterococcus faecalis TaxID=1351 RepID=UPI0024BF64D4|nr:helix-turn-helix domain-containing protein [Enterococcus faecalis]MDK0489646.1 helix-turn-helix domain-containing protein [Enterococcus faecalis]MDK0511466.1 helix-turn-helix domain-containing protein [Enterococcus faecalis]
MGSHKKLTLRARICIETMIYDKRGIQEIADKIGVSRTTIDRELQRVPEDLIYNADNAQLDSEMKRSHCGAKSKWTSELAYQIECDLEASWLPEQIANSRGTVSFKTIYHWLYNGFLNVSNQ